jgi:drug/metabolite transporter (DMT)-like permease
VEQEEAAPAAPAAVDDGGAEGGSAWDRLLAQVTSRRFRALAMLNAMTLLLAANWAILKSANDAGIASDMSLDPSTFTAMRFLLASVLFSGSLKQGFGDRAVVRAGTEMGAWCAAGYVTQCVALSMTPASRASLLSTFTVLIVPVFAALKGQKIKPLVWGCAGAAVLGTLLLEAGSSEPPNVGDAWAILSAAAFAAQLFRTEMLTADLPPSSSLPLMAVSMTTIAGITAAVAGIADWRDAASTADALGNMAGGVADVIAAGHPVGAPHAAGLLAAGQLAFTAFLSTALALLLELVALKDVSSTEAALVYSLEPVVGASLSCLFLGERFGPTGLAGAAIIMAAAVTTQVLGAPQGPEAAGGGGGEGASSSSS